METAKKTSEQERYRVPALGDVRYWLISERRYGRTTALAPMLTDGGGVLPVFSSEEEAATFLIGRGFSFGGWRVEEVEAGGLFAALSSSPCAGVKTVALDPMPQIADGVSARLVGVNADRFARRLSRSMAEEAL